MAIVRGASVILAEGGTTSTSLVVNVPAGVADNDVLVTFLGIGSAGLTPPSGWNLIGQATGQSVISSYVYYHIVTSAAGEPASYTWSGWTAARSTAEGARYSGVDNTTPIDVAASSLSNAAGATTLVLPSITTVTDGAMLVSCGGQDSATGTDTIPGTMSRVSDSTGTGKRFGSADETFATHGATGTRTWTFNSSTLAHSGVLGALRPAAAAGPVLSPPYLGAQARLSPPVRRGRLLAVSPPAQPPGPAVRAVARRLPAPRRGRLLPLPLVGAAPASPPPFPPPYLEQTRTRPTVVRRGLLLTVPLVGAAPVVATGVPQFIGARQPPVLPRRRGVFARVIAVAGSPQRPIHTRPGPAPAVRRGRFLPWWPQAIVTPPPPSTWTPGLIARRRLRAATRRSGAFGLVPCVCTVSRPDSGLTARPSAGATARPGTGTTARPASGITTRPYTGVTRSPCC